MQGKEELMPIEKQSPSQKKTDVNKSTTEPKVRFNFWIINIDQKGSFSLNQLIFQTISHTLSIFKLLMHFFSGNSGWVKSTKEEEQKEAKERGGICWTVGKSDFGGC